MTDDIVERTLDLPTSDVVPAQPALAAAATAIGHFKVTRELGSGGMGVVLEAYDPDLDRRVAIKLVKDRQAGTAAGRRLVEEAQAMARLAHPNVVAVYEVGTYDDQVFVVMELVSGDTLASWLQTARPWRDIVRVFAEAGDGLVAAHEAGLVHGDFKPSNVLIDETGRVRVADFGLARLDDREPTKLAAGSRPAGTPGYMAPEQLDGGPIDGRADQYAFAVALRQALQGHRVPRRIRRVIDRALSPDPSARFATMRDVLGELRAPLRTRRRAIVAALALAGASAAIAGGLAWSAAPSTNDAEACLASVALVDDVWTPAARTGAARGGESTVRLVDSWTGAWKLSRRTACLAAPSERPARLACLDRRLAELRAQVAMWSRGDRDVLAASLRAAAALPSPDSCTATAPVPRAASAPVIARIAEVDALRRAGRSMQAKALLPALLADATATGDPATLASAQYSAGNIARDLAAHDAAAAHFASAAKTAAAAGDDTILVDAMIMQSAVAVDRGQPREAIGQLDAVAPIVDRARLDRTVQLSLARGDAYTQAGQIAEAVPEIERAIAHLEPIAVRWPGARIQLAAAYGALAAAEILRYQYDKAQALLLRCLAIEEADYGRDHPEVAKTLHDLANAEARLQKFDDAQAHYERSRAVLVAAYGERHHHVALLDYSLAKLEMQRERPDAARPFLQRARDGLVATVGAEHPDVARIEGAMGYLERAADRCRMAIPHFERALQIVSKTDREGIEVAANLVNLGACLADVRRDAEARSVIDRALAQFASLDAPDEERSEAKAILAEIEWRAGRRARARELAEQVIASTANLDEPYKGLHDYMRDQLATWSRAR